MSPTNTRHQTEPLRSPARGGPQRIQLRRTKGWRKPEGAIVVARPSKWGNPFQLGDYYQFNDGKGAGIIPGYRGTSLLVAVYADWLHGHKVFDLIKRWDSKPPYQFRPHEVPAPIDHKIIRTELAGKDLACWCPLEDEHGNHVACHADVLLDLANRDAA